MAASGSVEIEDCAGDSDAISENKNKRNGVNEEILSSVRVFDPNVTADTMDKREEQILASCLASDPWINNNNNNNKVNVDILQGSTAPLTLCSGTDPELRRSLRIERAGSEESVVISSSGDSCHSSSSASDTASEPSSPVRPLTPQPMPPVPTQHCPYECLRADSEDSGLGPSPAKSLVSPTSPDGSISPIQFGRCEDEEDDRSDSLLDLSPRTDNSYESEEKGYVSNSPGEALHDDDPFDNYCLPLTETPAIPQSPNNKLPSGSSFQFLLSSTSTSPSNCASVNSNHQTRTDGFLGILKQQQDDGDRQFQCNNFSDNGRQFSAINERDGDRHFGDLDRKLDVDRQFVVDESDHRFKVVDDDRDFSVQRDESRQFDSTDVVAGDANKINNQTTTTSSFFGERACQDEEDSCQLPSSKKDSFVVQEAHLNPKVVLIRSDYSSYADESNSTRENSECTSSNCSQVGSVDQQSVSSSTTSDDGECKWFNCNRSADANNTATDLLDHIRECHVQCQLDANETYTCLWIGCKVFERPSCSRSWLERHILLHGGSKPFRCIVDGCHQRFGSEAMLQRHVNSHFPQSKGNKDNTQRLCKKRKHRHRKRPQFHKSKDFIDDATMEHVRHSLFQLSTIEGMVTGGPPSAITFHSTVVCKRMDEGSKVHYLLKWEPENILPDCWVPESEILSNVEKVIPLSQLPPQALQLPSLGAFNNAGILPRPSKRKRK